MSHEAVFDIRVGCSVTDPLAHANQLYFRVCKALLVTAVSIPEGEGASAPPE